MCADHVMIGQLVAREVQAAFDRHTAMVLNHETALARSRDALARDLHDNVAQSLAGAALRLEGLRKSIRAGHDPDAEILQLKEALRAEQKEVRGMIDRLRYNEQVIPVTNLPASIARLVTELSANWGVSIGLVSDDAIELPATLAYEVSNIVREAVANAVRHGSAEAIKVSLRRDIDWLTIAINDNGSGFPAGTGTEAPRSIRERVARHGGTIAVKTGVSGTLLKIGLPMGEAA
jgi:signal transduction histidine kinase